MGIVQCHNGDAVWNWHDTIFYVTLLVFPYLYQASLLDHDKQWDFTDALYSEGQTTGL
jgi:hypothetical protein